MQREYNVMKDQLQQKNLELSVIDPSFWLFWDLIFKFQNSQFHS
jgi:hypothetical protein